VPRATGENREGGTSEKETVSQETCQRDSRAKAHPILRVRGVRHMNTQVKTQTIGLTLSQRLVAGMAALLIGSVLLVGTGFAGDYRLHNGAHDTRHATGFPCH